MLLLILLFALLIPFLSYILIYHESKAEEIMFRHYLFICDGLNGQNKTIKKAPQKYDGTIDKSEFEELSKNIRSATLNYENGVNHAIDIIKSLFNLSWF